jgi:hypothetical protein
MLDALYKIVDPIFTCEEVNDIFNEMTSEIFQIFPMLRTNGSLMVHLFPDLGITHKDNSYSDGLPDKPKNHSKFVIKESTKLKSGALSLCRQDFLEFETYYEWYHFVPNDTVFGNSIRQKLVDNGYKPAHEWWISYMCPDTHFQRHVDGIAPLVRYSFVVKQPHSTASIEIGNDKLFFPEGTAYLMNGEIPHEVLNTGNGNRIMLLGSILDINTADIPVI